MGWPVEKLRAELALGPNSARSQAARERASMNYYPKASWAKAGFGTPEKFAAPNQTPDRGTAERSGVEFFPPLRPRRHGRPDAPQVDGRFAARTVAADPGHDRG